jgi:limonene-1,2-epoxide hydrolase
MLLTVQQVVEKVNTAFAENKMEDFVSLCTDDVRWNMVGENEYVGKEAILKGMSEMPDQAAPNFVIDKIVAADSAATCTGSFTMLKNGVQFAFCDVYEFEGGLIKTMTSYVVALKQ